MGFPLTMNGELDFDRYFSYSSEERMQCLEEFFQERMTPDHKEDIATVQKKIVEEHTRLDRAAKKDKNMEPPTLMQELHQAYLLGLQNMQAILKQQQAASSGHKDEEMDVFVEADITQMNPKQLRAFRKTQQKKVQSMQHDREGIRHAREDQDIECDSVAEGPKSDSGSKPKKKHKWCCVQ